MVKQFSTVRKTQRDSQSYIQKKEEGDRSDQEEEKESKRKRAIKPVIKFLTENGYWNLDSSKYKVNSKYLKAIIKNLEYGLHSEKVQYSKKKKQKQKTKSNAMIKKKVLFFFF